MATVHLALYCIVLLHAVCVQGFTISPPIPHRIFVQNGEAVTLFCNYTLTGESGYVLAADLYVNGTDNTSHVFTFFEFPGNVIRQNFSNHFASRSDVKFRNVRSPTTYFAVVIEHAEFNDSGNYTWRIDIDNAGDQFSGNIETIVGESPKTATLNTTHINDTTYELKCEVTGGIPVPDIQIRNTNNILLRSPSSRSASKNSTVTSEDRFYCIGTNPLGSVNSSYVILPESETTTSVPPSTSTLGGSDNSPGPAPSVTTPGDTGGSPGPGNKSDPGGKQGISNELLIALIVVGVVVVIAVIAIVIVLHKKSANKRQAKPDKTYAAEEHKDNQYSDMPMDETKHQQEQAEKQQRNIEGLQYADLDLAPAANRKPAGGGGRNNLVFDEDSRTEYAEVRKT